MSGIYHWSLLRRVGWALLNWFWFMRVERE
jgi:hypothetical protein